MTTPSTVSLLTRSMSRIVGGGWARVSAPRTPRAVGPNDYCNDCNDY